MLFLQLTVVGILDIEIRGVWKTQTIVFVNETNIFDINIHLPAVKKLQLIPSFFNFTTKNNNKMFFYMSQVCQHFVFCSFLGKFNW